MSELVVGVGRVTAVPGDGRVLGYLPGLPDTLNAPVQRIRAARDLAEIAGTLVACGDPDGTLARETAAALLNRAIAIALDAAEALLPRDPQAELLPRERKDRNTAGASVGTHD